MSTIAVLTIPEAEVKLKEILDAKQEMFDGEIGCVKASFKKRNYPMPDRHKQVVAEYLRVLEKKGIVSKQATQYVNPLVIVKDRKERENSDVSRREGTEVAEWPMTMRSHLQLMRCSDAWVERSSSLHWTLRMLFGRYLSNRNREDTLVFFLKVTLTCLIECRLV